MAIGGSRMWSGFGRVRHDFNDCIDHIDDL